MSPSRLLVWGQKKFHEELLIGENVKGKNYHFIMRVFEQELPLAVLAAGLQMLDSSDRLGGFEGVPTLLQD